MRKEPGYIFPGIVWVFLKVINRQKMLPVDYFDIACISLQDNHAKAEAA